MRRRFGLTSLLSALLFCIFGCDQPEDIARPVVEICDAPPAEMTASESMLEVYRLGLKRVFLETAERIELGELNTEQEVNQWIYESSAAVRRDAVMMLNLDASEIGGEHWTKTKAAAYWRKQGESL